MQNKIIIKGAREHNLKNISLELPRNKMIVFTGLSGSGKSSLAFDTIFAEGQRRYVESLSAYARQFLGGMQKPDVDEIEGLSPAISIDQKAHGANPRSTVATITEIYDYLRVLFARIGEPHCPLCGTKIEKMTVDQMVERVVHKVESYKVHKVSELTVLAPVVRGRKGEYYQMLYDMYNFGFLNVRVDGKMKSLKDRILMGKNVKHTIEVVVDKIPNHSEESLSNTAKNAINDSDLKSKDKGSLPAVGVVGIAKRLVEAVETAVDLSDGLCTVIYPSGDEQIFSTKYSCPMDGFSFPEIEPRLFSFNSPYGYCEHCTGLGTKTLFTPTPKTKKQENKHDDDEEEIINKKNNLVWGFSEEVCPKCQGKRLNENSLSVKINGKNIWELTNLDIADAREFFAETELGLPEREREIAGAVLKEIGNRLQFMFDVGLHYLTLNRRAGSLSGGEAQRIRLASQVGTRLVGALYVLDEPTIGLHQKDNDRLVKTLRNLCDVGNTIIVVEHDEDTILASDWVVDLGPGAGEHGGDVVYSGKTKDLLDVRTTKDTKLRTTNNVDCEVIGDPIKSLTGKYLRGELAIGVPEKRRKVDGDTPKLKLKGAVDHNLKNINVEIPLRRFVCLTGVSGSGKSTLMNDILYKEINNRFFRMKKPVGKHLSLTGTEYLDRMIVIDQRPIGRTPRSNPATYTKAYDHIRELFAEMPESKIKGYKSSRFSFNIPGGRCENCHGRGTLEIEMHFLPSVEIVCDVCAGKRFNQETLDIHFKEKNIAEVLEMTIEKAEDFFQDIPMIYDKLKILNEVGLDYLKLGQSATTLSGGEAQRIKLSRELAKHGTTKTLYLLDEPTTGLHYDDVRKLLLVLERLVNQGNTIMVIEHNLDVIKCADWIIDLGPEGGDKGGKVVATGTPEEVARKAGSYTGEYLKRVLK